MDNFLVLVDKIEDWQPFFPSEQVITVKSYLFDDKYQENRGVRIINLSRKLKYLSQGYYCSLLAEARGHKIIPNLKTINDLSKKNLYISDIDELQKTTTKVTNKLFKNQDYLKTISFRIFFRKTKIEEFRNLAREIFEYYPCPILEVKLFFDKIWQIESIIPVSVKDLTDDEETFFANSLEMFSNKMWRVPKEQKNYVYDLGILVNPDEKLPPSNQKALEKFVNACERNKVYAELITKKDLSKINEFDALFIRETTSISNHTYRFAKKAQSEGLVVIDDAESILKCTNKIFMSNLLSRMGIASIPGRFVSDFKESTLDSLINDFGLPLVVKIPDGSFSIGVSKVNDKKELSLKLEEMLKKSDLILVQKFLYTIYDWRIGVLGKEGFFACKYFMSENHWQIYNHEKDKDSDAFSGNAITMPISEAPIKVVDVAVRAASMIGNGLYGVDLKEDAEGNVYVVEINDNPNLDDGVEDLVLGDKMYDQLVQWFIKEIKKKKTKL